MSNNEMMLGVDGTLNIVPHHPAASATCGHRASIGVSQGYLLVLGLHHLSVQTVQALYLLAQRRNLFVEPGDLGLRHRFPLAIQHCRAARDNGQCSRQSAPTVAASWPV